MRLLACFVLISLGILGIWLLCGASLETRFTLEGSVLWLQGAGGWAWAAGIGLLISDVVLPVPGTVVMSSLGWIYGPLVGGIVAACGSACAGLAAFGACRLIGENFARRLLGDLDFERGRMLFAKQGGWAVALSRALPILPEAIACTAGLVRMPFSRFLGSLLCGCVPTGFLFAAIGAAGRESPAWALGLTLILPALFWAIARILAGASKASS